METGQRNLFVFLVALVVAAVFVGGFVIGGIGASVARAAPEATPTKVASAVDWTPTPTITPGPGFDQPVKLVWGQLPQELKDYFLRQPAIATPAPVDLIDFEVGKNGCRFTIDGNATEKLTDSLAGDCAELLRILNPVPPAPIVAPEPIVTPSPVNPFEPTFYQKDVEDPRDGKYSRVRVYLDYGNQIVTFLRETAPGSFSWNEARRMTNYLIQSDAVAYVRQEDGVYTVEIDYFDGDAVRSDIFFLDELFPLAQPRPEPKRGDGPFIWVTNAGGLGLFLTARVDENTLASVFSLREFTPDGTLLVDDWFVTSPVFEFRGAEMQDDGFVYIRYGTSALGGDIVIRHQPWFREVPTTVSK